MKTMTTSGDGATDWPLVKIKWADHWIDYGDQDMDEVLEKLKPYYGEYVGYLIAENKQMIAIASNKWQNGDPSEVMYIMKRAIVERKVLSSE